MHIERVTLRPSPARPASAGLLLYRRRGARTEVLLVHPGGPLWRNRWNGWWQIPKGEIDDGEDPLGGARREFGEELGVAIATDGRSLGEVRQAGGKRVIAFACEGDLDPAGIVSNVFELEWPPRSGHVARFPEIDAARWFGLEEAGTAMLPSQRPFLARLEALLPAG